MTVTSGKSKQDAEPVAAESGTPEQNQVGKSSDMQTYVGNGIDSPAAKPGVDKDVRNHLGRKLKASYDELVRQPVPDRFRQLLDELERQEKKR